MEFPSFTPRSWLIVGYVAGAAGGAAAIALMEELLAERTTFPLLFIPFATSIVLVMGPPEAEPAQPRALVGGHLLSTATELLGPAHHRRGAAGSGRCCRTRDLLTHCS